MSEFMDALDIDIFNMMGARPAFRQLVMSMFEDRAAALVILIAGLRTHLTDKNKRERHEKWCPDIVYRDLVNPFVATLYEDAPFMAAWVALAVLPQCIGIEMLECPLCDEAFRQEYLARVAKEEADKHDPQWCIDVECIKTHHRR